MQNSGQCVDLDPDGGSMSDPTALHGGGRSARRAPRLADLEQATPASGTPPARKRSRAPRWIEGARRLCAGERLGDLADHLAEQQRAKGPFSPRWAGCREALPGAGPPARPRGSRAPGRGRDVPWPPGRRADRYHRATLARVLLDRPARSGGVPLWDPGGALVLADPDPYVLCAAMRRAEAEHAPLATGQPRALRLDMPAPSTSVALRPVSNTM